MWFYSDHSLRAYLAVPSRGALTYCTPFNGGWPRHSFNHMATIQTCKCPISPAHWWEWVQSLLSAITQVTSQHHTGMHVTPPSSKINSKSDYRNLDTYWQTNSQPWANQVGPPNTTPPDHAEDSEGDNNTTGVSWYFNLIETLRVLTVFSCFRWCLFHELSITHTLSYLHTHSLVAHSLTLAHLLHISV